MAYGDVWTQQAGSGSHSWTNIAANIDGSFLIAGAAASDYTYSSDDYGVSWSQVTMPFSANWWVACNSDASVLYAASEGVKIYKSTDFGSSWVEVVGFGNWSTGLKCSSDGSILYCNNGNYLYRSINYGSGMTQVGTYTSGYIDLSPDATHALSASNTNGPIYYTHDSGSTWTTATGAGNHVWSGITVSHDGQHIAACTNSQYDPNYIWTSDDGGSTWTERTTSGNHAWKWIDGDATGQYLVAAVSSGYIYSSDDYGATWSQAASSQAWACCQVLSDASLAIAGVAGGTMYTNTSVIFTVISIFPNTGSTAGGTPVTITGTGFDPAATAAIDGNNLTDLTVVDSTTITGVTPAGTAGAKDVVVTNP